MKDLKDIDLINELWNEAEHKKDNVKIWAKIYNWLNEDNLSDIIQDNNIYWFELTSSFSTLPNYIYYYIKKWASKKGFTYLYDIKEVL